MNVITIKSLFNENVNKKLLTQKDKKLLVDIEGNLEIFIDERLYFADKNVLLLEFGIEFHQWFNNSFPNEDFKYYTMSHDKSILQIIHQAEGWYVDSIWKEFEMDYFLQSEVLKSEVERYLCHFEKQLWDKYKLKISYFI